MNGTMNELQRERKTNADLLASLQDVVRICEAMRYTAGLGKNQVERIEKAKALIAGRNGRAT